MFLHCIEWGNCSVLHYATFTPIRLRNAVSQHTQLRWKHVQDLSEAELWALDDKQRDEYFGMGERRRRAEFNRAMRTLMRADLLSTRAAAAPLATLSAEEESALATALADSTSKGAKGAPTGWAIVAYRVFRHPVWFSIQYLAVLDRAVVTSECTWGKQDHPQRLDSRLSLASQCFFFT